MLNHGGALVPTTVSSLPSILVRALSVSVISMSVCLCVVLDKDASSRSKGEDDSVSLLASLFSWPWCVSSNLGTEVNLLGPDPISSQARAGCNL